MLIYMKLVKNYLEDFVALFFPDLCAACGKNLFKGETEICNSCIYKLPFTQFHNDPANRVARQFWGRIEILQAGAFLYFQKGTRVQNLLHQLKYNKRSGTGQRLGELYGFELRESLSFIKPDIIIPVPLHPKKLKKRGYNQSSSIAQGMAKILEIPISEDNLFRTLATETQTKKSRFARYENMQDAFDLRDAEALTGKHILLVDDVITTGATLEACVLQMQKKVDLKISLSALAYAE